MTATLSISNLRKAFGRTLALDDVSLDLEPGEIHGLVGENGAGKSTLIKVVCGVHPSSSGTMRLFGEIYEPGSPARAAELGVALVPQELHIVPRMTVAENIFLNDWPQHLRFGVLPAVDGRSMCEQSEVLLKRLGVNIDPRTTTGTLSFVQRQFLVFARVLHRKSRILVLDEPTASLEMAEADRLFKTVERLRNEGVTILFVSHRLEEVETHCHRVNVLRDGQLVAQHSRGDYQVTDLVRDMTGREIDVVQEAERQEDGEIAIEATIRLANENSNVSARAGQATGLAGLLGAGGDSILRQLFGLVAPITAEVMGGKCTIRNPISAINAGMGYVPSERHLGIIPMLSVSENILLPYLGKKTRPCRETVRRLIELLDIRPADPNARAGELSGGNQQKVVFARWLVGNMELLLLDEPMHGIDIGAKANIHQLIRKFVTEGGSAIINSAELHELMGMCDRVLALRSGNIAAEFQRGDADYTERDLRRVLGG